MKILLDECMPRRLPANLLANHQVFHVHDLGWHGIQNGNLLRQANGDFDILLTIDKNMPFQQSLKGLAICVAVLDVLQPGIEVFSAHLEEFEMRIDSLLPGSFNMISLRH